VGLAAARGRREGRGRAAVSADPSVFISYRREETAGHAGRLYDEMVERLGAGNVFMDVDLEPGIDFVERITTAVGGCRALLVVMGPRWAVGADGNGQPRITDPADFVRLEVETALARPRVTVIPVLVAGARMPAPEQLPEPLRPLARRNAIELSDQRWRYDVGRLLDAIAGLLAPRPAPTPEPGVAKPLGPLRVLEGAVVAGLVGGLMLASVKGVNSAGTEDRAAKFATTVVRNALLWGVVGLVLAAWLAWRRGERGRIAGAATAGLLIGALGAALGSALFAAARFLPAETPSDASLNVVAVLALALVGGALGLALGRVWRPSRGSLGLGSGLVAAAATGLLLLAADAPAAPTDALAQNAALIAAVQAAVIAAAVLAALVTGGDGASRR
jgi:hypothetical protein